MKKFTLFFAALMMSVVSVSAADVAVYTVSAANGTNSNYAGDCDIVSNGITWNVQGNTAMEGQYAIGGWGLGGKKIINQDRAIYSKDAINANIKQVKVTHNANNGIFVNSFAMIVSDASNSAGDTVRATAEDIKAMANKEAVVTFAIPEGKVWNNKYYKFLYNLTNQAANVNKRIEFAKAEFFGEGGTDIPATAIALDQTTLELEQYKSAQLTATTTPADATTAITWTSSDEKIATVSAKGAITALTIGTTTITATAGELTATCTVTVKEATPITCAQAVEIAKTVSANNEIAAGGKYVIRGYVTEMASKDAAADIEEYGNYSVWMADTKDGGKVFEAFQVAPVDGKTIAAVGDYVEVVGDITKYTKGEETTYETVGKGAATIKILQSEGTAVENIKAEAGKAVKVIENGQLIIIRDNVRYNAVGAVIE